MITKSEKETYKFAKEFASKLKGGEVLCLIGDLGAGKTAFTKGLAQGLKVNNIITSPTFVLMKVYDADFKNIKKLAHIDAYRLNDAESLEQIGVADYFNDETCVTVVEWADRVKQIWPKDAIVIEFKILEGDSRELIIKN